MKKISMVLLASVILLGLTGCISTKTESTPEKDSKTESKKTVHVERYAIGWDGDEMGNEKPEWPAAYKEDGTESDALPKKIKNAANGKMTILAEGENSDKKLAREEARNSYSFQIAQMLNTVALTTYNEVIDNNEKTQATLQATASEAQFTGWERIGETWVQVRTVDNDKNGKITDTYRYYCLFACDKESFEAQAKMYLSKLLGEVVESKNRQKVGEYTDNCVKKVSNKGSLCTEVQPEEK